MPVHVEREQHVAVVTMDREIALNAFDADQLRELIKAFESLGQQDDVRAVVLTGAGSRAFAAGADVKMMATLSREDGLAFGRLGHQATLAIEGLPQPVIAAVNGFALGGGCEIALACDIRLASKNAIFAQPEVTLGIPPGWGGSQRLPRLIGPGRASEVILTGRRIPAEEALGWGLVNAVYAAERLLVEAKGLAAGIAKNSPRAVRQSKRLMRLAWGHNLALGLEDEERTFGNSFETVDQREGMTAFVEKRPAVFP
jgi:enoyl-CoA hydratase